ncbi:HotDog domain-containing protein [Globomyces pollinis-pini]|nr:HotDog domain-containing protein [Globomyces pollinis-pini]KAJ2992236.1 hypothetical protein HDV02_003194 [Globomyces sp. JEL0801]
MASLIPCIRQSLSHKVSKLVHSFPSVARFPVPWGEMDAFGHLNNVWHVRYVENGRFHHLETVLKKHFTATQYANFKNGSGVGIVIKSLNIQYKAPLTYPDNLIVATKIGKLDSNKNQYTQYTRMISETTELIIAEAEATIVAYDHGLKIKSVLAKEYFDAYNASTLEFGPQEYQKAKH